MKYKLLALCACFLALCASCSKEGSEVVSDMSADEALITFGLDFKTEGGALSRAQGDDEFFIAISPEAPEAGMISSGWVGRFDDLQSASILLKKGQNYNFYISKFIELDGGDAINLTNIAKDQNTFYEVNTATSYAPDFADKKLDRYYGSTSAVIKGNTTINITGHRFVYGINVEIEKPNEGTLKLTSNLDGFEYEVSSSDTESLSASNIFSLGGVDLKGTKSVTLTLSYLKNNQLVSSVTKTISIERNHYKVIKVDAPDALVNFGFTIADGEEAMTPDADVELSVQTANE